MPTAPAASPSPTASDDPGAGLGGFSCSAAGGGSGGRAALTDVRVGTAAGYDRFVLQFDGPVPPYTVTPQATSVFLQDASGRPQQLEGAAGIRIRVSPASGAGSYTGPIDFKPGYPVLRETRQIGDFEGVATWGLGLSRPACLRIFTLSSPSRLVIDIAT